MKIGLDDYLCQHTIEELKKLPVHQIKKLTITEEIESINPDDAERYDIGKIIKRIAGIKSETERALYIKKLSDKLGVSKRDISKDVKAHIEKEGKTQTIVDSNIIIAHPSYEVNTRFVSLGFKETVVIGDVVTNRNFYILSAPGGNLLIDKSTHQIGEIRLVFDERNRLLININDRWDKKKLVEFVSKPTVPEGLYQEIKQVLKQYIEFQKEAQYGLVSAWVIATYFHRCFYAFPFLFVYGKKQTGKSRTLDLLERLVFNAIKVKGVSVASLADSLDGVRGTFLNDQAESLSNPKNEEILGILADSYTVGGGKRRIVNITNRSRKVMEFETYSPKAFASIKEINTDLKDRCVQITMLRTMGNYPDPEAHLPIWQEIRDKLYRLALSKWQKVKEIYEETGKDVSRRVKELWRPIETVLKLEDVPAEEMQTVLNVFLESMIETQAGLSDRELELFDVLMQMLADGEVKKLTVGDMANRMDEENFKSRQALTIWIGKAIKQLSLYDKYLGREKNKHLYKFSYDHVKNVFDRYAIPNGTNGSMAEEQENQGFTDCHSKNGNGTNGSVNGIGANEMPLDAICKNQMAEPEPLKDKDKCHIAIDAIDVMAEEKNKNIQGIDGDDWELV